MTDTPEEYQVEGDVAREQQLVASERPSARGMRMVRLGAFEPACALSDAQRDAYCRRFRLLFANDATARRGGLGQVVRATNAQGETFALKTLVEQDFKAGADDETAAARERAEAAFREEYEVHRALSGLRGFPRLYGWGMAGGAPAIVMEWVEGDTLAHVVRGLAVDGDDRLSPLIAARLGRDLFELVVRMGLVGGGIVHRDISPANVMVRTTHLSLERQLAEGQFDLCLIDFGSSAELGETSVPSGGFTERSATMRRATPAYAPPEMLSDDLPRISDLRHSSAIDVYAAASVVYELAAGRPPFAGIEGQSPYRIKADNACPPLVCCHEAADDLPAVLTREPEVALSCAEVAQQLSLAPDAPELAEALAFADAQLGSIIAACLVADQKLRPSSSAVKRALSAFCETYGANIGHSLRREPLEACSVIEERVLGRRALVRSGQALVSVVWLGAIAFCAYANTGAWVAVGWGSVVAWSGNLASAGIALLLAVPFAVALVARGRWASTNASLKRAGVALAVCEAALLALVASTAFAQVGVLRGVVATIALTAAAAWTWLVLGWAAHQRARGPRPRPLPAGQAARSLEAKATPLAPTLSSSSDTTPKEDASHD